MPPVPDVRRSPTVVRVPRVEAMMSRRFVRAQPETAMTEVARLLLRHGTTVAAVSDAGGAFQGFVSDHGVLTAFVELLHDERPVASAVHYLDPPTPTLRERTPLLDALEAFAGAEGRPLQVLPVLQEAAIVGVVTRLDAIRAAMDYVAPDSDQSPATLYMSALKESHEKPPY